MSTGKSRSGSGPSGSLTDSIGTRVSWCLLELRDPGWAHPLWGAYKALPHLFWVLSPALLPLKTEVRPLTLSGVGGGMAEEGGSQS